MKPPWSMSAADLQLGEDAWQEQYHGLRALGVIGAGLGDGINPCAFAVIVFFISYMAFAGKSRTEMLRAGLLYTAAVFVTYLAIGLGLYGLLGAIARPDSIANMLLNIVMAGVTLLGCLLSIMDGIRVAQGEVDKVTLKLPEKAKGRIRRLMTEQTRAGLTAVGALGLGAVVAIFEFPCTGQIYLPIVQALRELEGEFLTAGAWLLLYNLCFIAPLVAVFFLLMLGVSSEALAAFYRRHLALAKFITAALFAGLFAWFMYRVTHG
jgi:cytochrome c biogenesis protein CcdA